MLYLLTLSEKNALSTHLSALYIPLEASSASLGKLTTLRLLYCISSACLSTLRVLLEAILYCLLLPREEE